MNLRFPKLSLPERKPREPDPPGVTITAGQVETAYRAKWFAAAIAAYFLWSFCVETSGDQASMLHATHVFWWIGDARLFFPLVAGFALVAISTPLLATNAITWYVALRWNNPQQFWPKLGSLVLVVGGSLALIASSFSVMGGAIIEHGRGAAVAVEQVQKQNAGLAATVAAIQKDIDDIAVPSSAKPTYQMQACRVGAGAWEDRLALATTYRDTQIDMIKGALAYAKKCDALREQRRQAMVSEASATTIASVDGTPKTSGTAAIATAMDGVRVAWPLLMSVLNDIVCLLAGYIALRLDQARKLQLDNARPEPMSDAYQIADHSQEAKLDVDPNGPRMNKVVDALTGEELVHVKGHMRVKRPKKNGRTEATLETTPPEQPVFETPAIFGNDPRVARAAANLEDERTENVYAAGDEKDASEAPEVGRGEAGSEADGYSDSVSASRQDVLRRLNGQALSAGDDVASVFGEDESADARRPEQEAVDERDVVGLGDALDRSDENVSAADTSRSDQASDGGDFGRVNSNEQSGAADALGGVEKISAAHPEIAETQDEFSSDIRGDDSAASDDGRDSFGDERPDNDSHAADDGDSAVPAGVDTQLAGDGPQPDPAEILAQLDRNEVFYDPDSGEYRPVIRGEDANVMATKRGLPAPEKVEEEAA